MLDVYSEQEFNELQESLRTLEPRSFIFVKAEFNEQQFNILRSDKRFFIITARENGNVKIVFHCICHTEDTENAVATVHEVIERMGGENISGNLMS